MRDPVRVTLESDDEERTVRVHDEEGEVSVGGATFRFTVSGRDDAGATDCPEATGTSEAEDAVSDSTSEDDAHYIASVNEIPTNGTLRFEAVDGEYGVEGILQRTDDTVLGWENSCPHKPEVRLDKGFGALVNGDQLICHKHGARFNCDDGFCTRGPCRGSVLNSIAVDVRDGEVYLSDDRFDAAYSLDG